MAAKADPTLVRRALDQARNQRAQITRGALLPIDTAHLIGQCPNCGRLGFTVLGFPDPPYAGPQGQPRYRNARELERFLDEIVKRPPPMPAPNDKNQGQQCECGAPADPRDVVGVRFMHAMPGSGAELIVEGTIGGGSLLLSASGGSLGGESFTWKLFRAPLDGIETEVGTGFDDGAVEKNFGRALTLAQTWLAALSGARNGKEVVEQVEPGYWLYAGPKDNKELDDKIKAAIGGVESREAFGLIELGSKAPMPAGPAWPQWAHEYAESIAKGDLRAGVILDREVVLKLVTSQLDRLNIGWRLEDKNSLLIAEVGEARWPVEMVIVTLGAAHLGWTLAETAAAAVGEAAARVQGIGRYLAEIRRVRPDVTFKVEDLRCTPIRKDGTAGRPINLMVSPFRLQPGTPEFDRELRFVCDEVAKDKDATKVCPCGAEAFVAARLFPWSVVEEFKKASGDKAPAVIESWPENAPKAALLATISCDMHVRIPAAFELEKAGLQGDTLTRRLATDLSKSVFAVDVQLHEDDQKRRALLAYGPLVASVVMNDHLVSSLHQACGRPLRATELEAQVLTPNVLLMFEEDFEDNRMDQVIELAKALDGIPPKADPPFSLTWDVKLNADPVGRFMNLYPPQDGQQQAPQGGNRPPPPGRGPAQPPRAGRR